MIVTQLNGAASSTVQGIRPFALERFFAQYEFTARHQLCCSDSEPMLMSDLLGLADEDAQQRWHSLRLSYTETQGLPALREAIAAYHYTSVAADQVVVAAPQELIYLAMLALLRPGDRVVCCFPGYQSLYEVASSLGCQVVRWELGSAPDGSLRFDLKDAQRLLTSGTRMVVVNSPHNPSGAHFPQAEWQELCTLCSTCNAYLFSDEMYRTLELHPDARLPAAADMLDSGISLSGMSKAAGGPGLRIGWLASKDAALVRRVLELKDYTSICSSAPSEVLALIGVRSWHHILSRQLVIIRANLAALQAFFARWQDIFDWHAPVAGTVAFPRLLTGEDVAAWCEELVHTTGVLLLPGSVYEHAQYCDRFRQGFGRQNLPECLQQLETFLHKRYRQNAQTTAT